ncbi:DUF5659 domain-containing protein [Tepidanaerobacter syntrophicus]|uniref:DUF5659 domain-containing protein n=1 Tax=Tepidanaerobacter syntrophicus TaxID=224999 RepID=A0A0U9HGV3_9FIRM|nr:DUF5659 domain-containing protein [Tepidanaerobacter syntrophicus]GAQ26037.1 hypothetical protein TSYNT_9293 [Tepidanaerobacter syntrophicus]HHV82605.1 hypothetical protein [Tepidanaerobacter syntrophicus]
MREYRTKSINIATVLLTQGVKLKRVEGDREKYFVFEDTEDRPKIIQDFINKELKVNINDFLNNQKNLKNLIFS